MMIPIITGEFSRHIAAKHSGLGSLNFIPMNLVLKQEIGDEGGAVHHNIYQNIYYMNQVFQHNYILNSRINTSLVIEIADRVLRLGFLNKEPVAKDRTSNRDQITKTISLNQDSRIYSNRVLNMHFLNKELAGKDRTSYRDQTAKTISLNQDSRIYSNSVKNHFTLNEDKSQTYVDSPKVNLYKPELNFHSRLEIIESLFGRLKKNEQRKIFTQQFNLESLSKGNTAETSHTTNLEKVITKDFSLLIHSPELYFVGKLNNGTVLDNTLFVSKVKSIYEKATYKALGYLKKFAVNKRKTELLLNNLPTVTPNNFSTNNIDFHSWSSFIKEESQKIYRQSSEHRVERQIWQRPSLTSAYRDLLEATVLSKKKTSEIAVRHGETQEKPAPEITGEDLTNNIILFLEKREYIDRKNGLDNFPQHSWPEEINIKQSSVSFDNSYQTNLKELTENSKNITIYGIPPLGEKYGAPLQRYPEREHSLENVGTTLGTVNSFLTMIYNRAAGNSDNKQLVIQLERLHTALQMKKYSLTSIYSNESLKKLYLEKSLDAISFEQSGTNKISAVENLVTNDLRSFLLNNAAYMHQSTLENRWDSAENNFSYADTTQFHLATDLYDNHTESWQKVLDKQRRIAPSDNFGATEHKTLKTIQIEKHTPSNSADRMQLQPLIRDVEAKAYATQETPETHQSTPRSDASLRDIATREHPTHRDLAIHQRILRSATDMSSVKHIRGADNPELRVKEAGFFNSEGQQKRMGSDPEFHTGDMIYKREKGKTEIDKIKKQIETFEDIELITNTRHTTQESSRNDRLAEKNLASTLVNKQAGLANDIGRLNFTSGDETALVEQLTNKIYSKLERKLRTEQMRKGMI